LLKHPPTDFKKKIVRQVSDSKTDILNQRGINLLDMH
jgi:hypothetical protein